MLKIMNHVDVELKRQRKNQDGLSAWSSSRSPEFEAKAIKTICKFGRNYDCVIYFVHIGSERALLQIQEEKNLELKFL